MSCWGFLCYAYKVSTVSRKPAQSRRKAVRARWGGVTGVALACSKEDGQLCPMHKSTIIVTICIFDVVRTAHLYVVKTTSLGLTDLLPPSFRPTGSFRVFSPIMRSALWDTPWTVHPQCRLLRVGPLARLCEPDNEAATRSSDRVIWRSSLPAMLVMLVIKRGITNRSSKDDGNVPSRGP